jgi:RNA polymerase sigma-70 factor (ECF subfamily)
MLMNDATSLSLLHRAANLTDGDSWEQLAALYDPLLRRWLATHGIQSADADDLVQEVFTVIARDLPRFDHQGQTGSFRSWLRKILVHRLHNFWRKQKYDQRGRGAGSSLLEQLHQLEDEASELSRIWNAEHDRYVIARLLDVVRPSFQEKTWEAFRRQMYDGHKAEDVAAELGMSLGSVYMARNRVLNALRREGTGLLDPL